MYDNYLISFPSLGVTVNPSRVAFTLFGKSIYWYGVIIAACFLLGVLYATRNCRRFGIVEDDFFNCLILGTPAAVICGRIYYVVFNYSSYRGDFASVFRIWEGGLAMFGVLIGAVLTVIIYCRVKKNKIMPMLDIVVICMLFAQALGRWGNFLNREAFGLIPQNAPAFIERILHFFRMNLTYGDTVISVQPTFLYESVWNLLGVIFLHLYSRRRKYDGQIFLMYLMWYGFGRFFIEGLRTDSLYLFSTGLRVSQLVAAAAFISSVAILLYIRHARKPDPERMAVALMDKKKAEEREHEVTAAAEAAAVSERADWALTQEKITGRAKTREEAKAKMIAEARELGLILDENGNFVAQVDPEELHKQALADEQNAQPSANENMGPTQENPGNPAEEKPE